MKPASKDSLAEAQGWLRLKLRDGYASSLFLAQLSYGFQSTKKFQIGPEEIWLDGHAVIGAVEAEEFQNRVHNTQPSSEFRSALKGIRKKHFYQASNFWQNNINQAQSRSNGRNLTSRSIQRVLKDVSGTGDINCITLDKEHLGALAHHAVIDMFKWRAGLGSHKNGSLTGEWIVFIKTSDGNRYLTLAHHGETNRAIGERVLACATEFPEILNTDFFSTVGLWRWLIAERGGVR